MFTRLHKLAFALLAVVSLVGGSFSGYQKTAGKLQMATVVYNQDTGLYTDDFADATGIAANTQAGVDVASGMVKLQNAVGGYVAPYLDSGTVTLQLIKPLRVASWGTVSIVATTPPGTSIKVQALDAGSRAFRNVYLSGNETGVSAFPVNMSNVPVAQCADQYFFGDPGTSFYNCGKPGAIYLKFTFATTDPNATPSIDSMQFTYTISRGDLTASPLSTDPWPTSNGDSQLTNRSAHSNPSTYPAFRWASAEYPASKGSQYTPESGLFKILVLGDKIIANAGYSYLVGIDKNEGSELWRLPSIYGYQNSAISQNGTYYSTNYEPDQLYAVDTATGIIKWTYDFYGGHGSQNVVIGADGTIYTIRNNAGLIDTVYAFYPNGTVKWTKTIENVGNPGDDDLPSAMAMGHDGTLYYDYGLEDHDGNIIDMGKLYALDPTDGTIKWSYEVGNTGTTYIDAPLVDGSGTIYVGKQLDDHAHEVKLYAINPDGTLKWERSFGTGTNGIASMALRSDGNIWVDYRVGWATGIKRIIVSHVDGSTILDLNNTSIPISPQDSFALSDSNNGIYYTEASPSSDAVKINYYDSSNNFKWQIPYAYDLIDGNGNFNFYHITRPVIDANGWIYSGLSDDVLNNVDFKHVFADEFAQLFALAPWTLTPQTSTSTVFRGDDISFTVVTSMQEENPLTTEANQMQIVLDTGVKVPLVYSSTNGDGDTIWTGTYTTPVTMEARTHTFTVQANQPLIKTDITVAFDAPATGSDNTGLTAPGSFNVITRGGGSPSPPPEPPPAPAGNENGNANQNVNVPSGNGNENQNINLPPLTAPGLVIPGKPVVYQVSPTEVRLVIDPNGNTVPTRFWIQDSISGKYVQADGTLGDTPFVKTFLDWGGDDGVIIKVKPNTRYKFRVAARPGV